MAQSVERSCTFLVAAEALPSPAEIKAALEDGDDRSRAAAMRAAVSGVLNGGEPIPGLFITIVRYVLPSEDHTVQKLLLLYLETIEKTDASGKLLPEMILICQNLRNNLQHPNEYVRGCTLRFLCRLREEEIVEPLAPSVLACLEHRHSYVRRNAVLALGAVYRLPRGDALLADAPDAVAALLEGGEQDASTRRAAFAFLGEHAPDRAAAFLLRAGDGVAGWTEALQLAALELVRRQCRADPARNKPRFLGTVLALLGSASPAVQFECATTLLALSRAPSAARAAGATLAALLRSQSDNNVKLIVLGRLSDLKKRARDVVADLMMDVLAAGLGSADADVRSRTLSLALDLISLRNVDGAVAVLKKEIVAAGGGSGGGGASSGSSGSSGSSSSSDEAQAAAAHRAELVRALHAAAARFPDVAGSVVPLLMDFIADGGAPPPPLTAAALLAASGSASGGGSAAAAALAPLPPAAASTALDVAVFAREIAATRPGLRADILRRVVDALPLLRAPRAACVALWMLGEFCEDPASVAGALDALKAALGPLPIVSDDDGGKKKKKKKKRTESGASGGAASDDDDDENDDESAAARAAAAASAPSRPQVLPDGSYATQSAQLTAAAPASAAAVAKAGATAGKGAGGGGALAAAAALAAGHSLRAFVLSGDPLVGPATSAALTKLVLRLAGAPGAAGSKALNRAAAEAMLAIAALLRAATTVNLANPSASSSSSSSSSSAASIDGGGVERMQACLRALAKGVSAAAEASKQGLDDVARPWLSSCRAALDAVVAASVAEATAAAAAVAAAATAAAPDDPLDLSLLRGKGGGDDGALDGDDDLGAAVAGSGDGSAESAVTSSSSDAAGGGATAAAPPPPRVVQLTGVGDPVYVEACLTTHAYDIALDVTMLNRTRKTLTNVALELATLGDLKLAERPRPVTLAPGATAKVRACVKVASTETGAIFGNVTFDAPPSSAASASGMEPPSTTVVTLADIHVDVMSFVSPAVIPDADFRERWASHEWENKIAVATDIPSAKDFLHHVARVAHMKVLTPPAALAGDCRFLAANLYARSRFGEDALLNLAVEEGADGRLAGAVRIRSKTQGMALSVGDVLILKQKGSAAAASGGTGSENAAPAAEIEVQ